jgi:two-component system sensor histidine kinase DegS
VTGAADRPDPATGGAPQTVGAQVERELEGLKRELTEIGLLVEQSRSEAARHEQKRVQAAERAATLAATGPVADLATANAQLVTLTRRAAIMEAQLDVLAGKQRTLERYRDGLARVRDALAAAGLADAPVAGGGDGEPGPSDAAEPGAPGSADAAPGARADGRIVLVAQEDLRREIARALHDGPVQSLANIVLQAQIVDRLVERDPAAAKVEVDELVAMVQRTLETTKTFIFDVRPMVLDDLGLVPTLRRVAREAARRSGVPVAFESAGADRRLPMDLESAVFRIADEALEGLLAGAPERVTLGLDWREAELELSALATWAGGTFEAVAEPGPDMPEALRAMVNERRASAAARDAAGGLPAQVRREIADRAAAAGGRVELAADGRAVTATFWLPAATPVP